MALAARSGIFYGWWVLAVTAIIGAFGGGLYTYGFAAFFLPLSGELGLSRAVTSLIFAVSRMEGGLYGAVSGWFVDRFGPRPLFIMGGLTAGLGYMLLSRVDSPLFLAVVYLVILSFGSNAGVIHPASAAVNSWFIRRKGITMGIISAAFATGGAVGLPLLGLGIQNVGWRSTALLVGIVVFTVVPALALLVPRSPESVGLLPDGDPAPVAARSVRDNVDFTVRGALRTPSLWLLAIGLPVRYLVQGAVLMHVLPLLVDRGVAPAMAAALTGAIALVSIPSRLGVGWLGDRVPKRYLLAGAAFVEIAGLLILLIATELWQLYVFVVVYALGYGGAPLCWAMVGEYYGRRTYATLRGLLGFVYTWGSLAGPVFAGWVYDQTHSYQVAIITFIVLYLPVVFVYWCCRKPVQLVRAQDDG